MNFFTKLQNAIHQNDSLLCVGLDPTPENLPRRYQQSHQTVEENLLAWNAAIIEETAPFACAYKPNIAFYEALGKVGFSLLNQTLALIPSEIPIILDVKRGDIGSTAEAYAKACFEVWKADAVTLSPYLGYDSIAPFAAYADKGLFVLCHTSNASANEFQKLEIADWHQLDREPNQALYIHVARTAISWSPNVAFVVGATFAEEMTAVRTAVPDRWFLAPGIGSQGGDLARTMAAGLRQDGEGLIVNASRNISMADSHRSAAKAIRDAMNQERALRSRTFASTQNSSPSTSTEIADSIQRLIIGLADLEAVRFGDFTLASGKQSPFYIDLRLLVSRPAVLSQIALAYASLLSKLEYDRVAGIPYAALPIGTAVALAADAPMIYTRKEKKSHGMGKDVEGYWNPGERVVVVEDLVTSGGSIIQSVERLRELGLIVEDAIVLIDREQGAAEKLAAAGISLHSVFKLITVLDVLVAAGALQSEKRQEVLDFVQTHSHII